MDGICPLFRAQAERTPEGTALVYKDQSVGYAALRTRVDQLARVLRRKNVRAGSVVAIGLSHSPALVAALLAVDQIRAVYVGIDSAWPLARVHDALESSRPSTLLIDAVLAGLAPSGCDVTRIEDVLDPDDPTASFPAAAAHANRRKDELHSIVYTSGTTGQPRGVLVTVGSVLARLRWMWQRYPFRQGDTILLHRSCSVVGFSWECFGGLLQGVPTIINPVPDRRDVVGIAKAAIGSTVTHVAGSVGFWETVLDWAERQPSPIWPTLRVARVSGESLPPGLVARWQRAMPRAALLNIYGATECNGVIAFEASTLAGRPTRVPIGQPLPGADALIVDAEIAAVADGVQGEVLLGGAMLAHGYLDDPALTASRFVPHPASRVPGARMFRTGDVGWRRSDGLFEIAGRSDLQVKVRGYRVEIEAVEQVLLASALVRAAAIDARSEDGDTRLVAFIVPRETGASAADLRAALAAEIPDYMMPAEFVAVSELPRLPNGKLDRVALTRLEGMPLRTIAGVAPLSASEITLAAIWSEVLRMTDVGAEDNLFEIGGDSLIAARIASRVEEAFGLGVPVRAVFDRPSVRALASHIDAMLLARRAGTVPI